MCNMSEYGKRKDMDNNEVTTALPNVKWKIMDADRAKEHRLELIKIEMITSYYLSTSDTFPLE